jgi:glycosyltransferase involved in cell wall biosynthesis
MATLTFSIVVPVYRNEESLPDLLPELEKLSAAVRMRHRARLEAVFVVDGSPDRSLAILADALPRASFPATLIAHSRNFGSFAAIRTGLGACTGDYMAAWAADLQEPPSLMLDFFSKLASDACDVVVGTRASRSDPPLGRFASTLFWRLYRALINRDIPAGGVDVFGCNRRFRDELVRLPETNSSLVGLIFWLGFRRAEVRYDRQRRRHGKSAWSLGRKLNYLLDSVFSFTDRPVKILIGLGMLGVLLALALGATVLVARLIGNIDVPGYTATVLIVLFFGGLNALGLGIVGMYAWRGYENTKARPLALVMSARSFPGNDVGERESA